MERQSQTLSVICAVRMRSYPYHLRTLFLCWLMISACTACSNVAQERQDIGALLDARDQAISNRDLPAYAALLIPDYQDRDQGEFEVINRMRRLFEQFDRIEMHGSDRTIRILDKAHAQCEQSYLLRVHASGIWRQISQRERIGMTRTESGWRISSGL